ncbi:G protein-coupled receptor 161-like [Sitophilus oryzae]|uniref:G protein-coupled receptor 161-like n=1 Tax=Sitophilus oryzae TaxID=7048 RepID=A0A6J2YHH9_SITOR|nr:G protein-coupled receptor 161-like [Sitophilus oryzae]
MTLVLSLLLTILCTVGIIFNVYIVLIILLTRQVSSANNILLLHLGVLNIPFGILFLVFCIPGIKETQWAIAGAPCTTTGFLFTLVHPLLLWTICGLNCDRYYAIATPLHYTNIISTQRVISGLAIGWVNSFLFTIPPLFNVSPYRYMKGLGVCIPDFNDGRSAFWYAVAYTCFTLLLPATVLICCNAKILIIARYHRHRIASAIYEVTLSAQVTITHQRNPFFVPTVTAPSAGGPKFRGPNAVFSVFQLVGSFLVMHVPYYVLVISDAMLHVSEEDGSTRMEGINLAYAAAETLLICSPAINGYLYGLKNKSLRKAFMNYWRKKQTKNEVNHEIQARTPSTCGSRRPSLTPFGLFAKNATVSRRMSETLIDVNRSLKNGNRSRIKRITSDLMWRPSSATNLNLSPKEETPPKPIKQTISCNTLRVPEEGATSVTVLEEDIRIAFEMEGKADSPSKPYSPGVFLKTFFKFDQEKVTKKAKEPSETSPKRLEGIYRCNECFCSDKQGSDFRSPRILITRAYSEESEKNSQGNSPSKDINRKHSNSASNLVEKKWRTIKYEAAHLYLSVFLVILVEAIQVACNLRLV